MTIADESGWSLRKPTRKAIEPGKAIEPAPLPGEVVPVVPVDAPVEATVPTWHELATRPARREPVVVPWLRDRQARRDVAVYGRAYVGHRIAYHGVRMPTVYLGRAVRRAPLGTYRAARWVGGWVFDREGAPARQAAVLSDPALYLRLVQQRNDRVKTRVVIAGLAALPILGGVAWLAWFAPRWAPLVATLATLAVLGRIGSSKDKPLLGRAVIGSEAPRLTSDVITRALCSLGIAEINQAVARDENAIGFPAPIQRDGPGWRAEIELPHGAAASTVIERRERLAAGLKRPLGCVWPECNASVHPGRLILWVGDQDMATARQAAWPLARSGAVDLFRPFQFGTDQRGRPVTITLMFASMVIGAIPRMGKTFSLRLLLLAAALDPRAQIHAYDLKGTGDLSALEAVAHRYRAGTEDEDIDYLVDDLRELEKELARRAKVIRTLPREVCPENKVTPQLASRRDLGLHPIVLGLDECGVAYEDKRHGAEIERIVEAIVKRGPALGMIPINATQRPDARSLPTGISGNAILRFCLKVMGQVENDMVLGTSAYKNGIRATMFSRRDLGIGLLLGEGEEGRTCRTHNIDGPAAAKIAARARALREAENRLTGYAVGQEPERDERPAYDLLADVLDCVKPTERTVWSETVLEALGELRPEVYAGWTTTMLAQALGPLGVKTKDVKGKTAAGDWASKKGIAVADVRAARGDG